MLKTYAHFFLPNILYESDLDKFHVNYIIFIKLDLLPILFIRILSIEDNRSSNYL